MHIKPEKFEKDVYVNNFENTLNVFRPHFVGEIWKPNIWFVFEEIVMSSFWKKLHFENVFRRH